MVQPSSISTVVSNERELATDVSEETLNQFTHGIGLGLSILAAIHLLAQPINGMSLTVGCWIYVASMIALFAASTLSHSFEAGRRRRRFRTLDQICIFIFMAGIYTPVSMRACSDGWWSLPLILMWGMAAVGVLLKLRVTKHEMVPVWFYLTLGAIPLLAFPKILATMGSQAMLWILGAACCYLVGIIFLTNDHRHRYFHPIWHVCVVMGSVCHYIVIVDYTITIGAQ